jgi:hypothetical protein
MGRPSKYRREYPEQAAKLCALGATDAQLADFFSVDEKTINTWKKKHPEFLQSLKEAKDDLDAKVERGLFEKATGYSVKEEKVFNNNGEPMIVPITKNYPPDTTAMIFWLKNRQPSKWRDKPEIDREQAQEITVVIGGSVD